MQQREPSPHQPFADRDDDQPEADRRTSNPRAEKNRSGGAGCEHEQAVLQKIDHRAPAFAYALATAFAPARLRSCPGRAYLAVVVIDACPSRS